MELRTGFSSRIGFIAAAAGSAVGLGNIWKFPFEVGESGGAAFVLIYLIFCFLLCFPLLVTEIAIGRKAQRNPVGAFKVLGYGRWSFIGKLGILSCVLILSFYNVVAGWCFGYFVEMLLGNFSIGEQFPLFVKDIIKVGGYSILFMGITAYIVSKGVSGGIEKASKILMPVLISIILLLAGYALTLPSAPQAIQFYLFPDFSKITGEVVYNALGHAFFSLSLGLGAMITYGSYMSKKDNIEERHYCELKKFYLARSCRGLGLGLELIKSCLQEALKLGYRYCYLQTHPALKRAGNLYEKLGFKPVLKNANIPHYTTSYTWYMKTL